MLVEKEDYAVNVKGTMNIHETPGVENKLYSIVRKAKDKDKISYQIADRNVPGMEDSKVENKIIKSKNNDELH